jgi:hypothetical protein
MIAAAIFWTPSGRAERTAPVLDVEEFFDGSRVRLLGDVLPT